ncbi:uncharacterized protein LOC106151944 isoform X2 [Lingula anatina]|uniref:Uncharacterized protein LOC106151944 isoform X2 n=1 Tax=Lingula anatina TaxID=7574 RepID=A0A1S3H5V0_LINAN|nr:uncharacterized protein LOC106151944 isoform X2 [Lingula anatina]|eukprot:XP_013380851.1 uncharacterized protein LOC106151944 isoform X2 [Lingula anatina]
MPLYRIGIIFEKMFSKLPNSLQGTMQPEAPPWCLGSHRWLNKCWESIQHLITQQLENFTRTRKKAVLVIDSMQKLIYDCTSKLEKVKRLEKDLEQILSRSASGYRTFW